MHTNSHETPPPLKLDRVLELVGDAQQGIAVFDETDRLVHANAFYRRLLAIDEHAFPTWKEILRSNHRHQNGTRIITDDFEAWIASAASRRGKLPFRAFETDMQDGRWIHVAETTLSNGWMLCVMTDITELGVSERLLRQQRDLALRAALSDTLTGLSNRRHMQEVLATLQVSAQAGAAAIVLLDIDHFKRVNDTHGHDEGDMLLRHFARLLQRHTRREDLAARWGGEEFLVLLREINVKAANEVVGRLFHEVRQSTPLPQLPALQYTCSAGVIFFREGEDVKDALKRADEALYEAKAAGRDRWVMR